MAQTSIFFLHSMVTGVAYPFYLINISKTLFIEESFSMLFIRIFDLLFCTVAHEGLLFLSFTFVFLCKISGP